MNLHKIFNEWSIGFLIFNLKKNEFFSIFIFFILISQQSNSSNLLSPFKITLSSLTCFFLTSTGIVSANKFISKNLITSNDQLSNQLNEINSSYSNKIFSKSSIFPCLDNLELNFLNSTQFSIDFNHFIRVYHSNDLNQSSHFSNQINNENQLTYVKEFMIDPWLINSKFFINCNLFDPNYLVYCFRFVSINKKIGQISFESDLHCLSTLKENQFNEQNFEKQKTKGSKKANLNNGQIYSSKYGSSLRLSNDADRRILNKKQSKRKQVIQQIVCNCGNKIILNYPNLKNTIYLIQLTSGNGYCTNGDYNESKNLIKIKRLDFEFCFLELTFPWIQLKVKDALLLNKKDQDLNQQKFSRSFNSNNLIIRNGNTFISPQLNYLNSFPTFHYISSQLLRFEFKQLGNQYTIELNYLNDEINELNSRTIIENLEEALERSENKLNNERNQIFQNERKTKLNYTKHNLMNLMNQTNESNLKSKLNQIKEINHVAGRKSYEFELHDFKLKQNQEEDDSSFVLLIDQNGQNLLIDNQLNLNEKINLLKLNDFSNDDHNLKIINQLKTNKLVLNLIALILFLLIGISILIFIFILFKTKIQPPTGNLIRFGLSNELYQTHNDYQEVQFNLSNRLNLKSTKLIKIDEEAIYESCKTKNSISQDNSSDESDQAQTHLFSNSDDSEIESQSVENELSNLSKKSSDEFSNTETLKNESTFLKSSFKDDLNELNKRRKMFKNCLNNCDSKDDLTNNAVGRLSQCSFPCSEISLELMIDYYDYLTPFPVPKPSNDYNS